MDIEIKRLHHLLRYDEATGKLFWRRSRGRTAKQGQEAGSINKDGYRFVRIDRQLLKAHRVAYALVHNVWPVDTIDHINRQKDDNRFSNLRLATYSEQSANRSMRVGSCGYRGVSFVKGSKSRPYKAEIRVDRQTIYLGCFSTAEEAAKKYDQAVIYYRGPSFPTNANLGLL